MKLGNVSEGLGGIALGVSIAIAVACYWSNEEEPAKIGELVGQGQAARKNEARQSLLKERPQYIDPRAGRVGDRLADLEFRDLEGVTGRLSELWKSGALVVCVRDVGCPVSKRQGGRLARLEETCRERGVPFLFVNPSTHNTPDEMRGEIELHGFQGRYVADEG